jgi:hypothetical protein
MDYGELVDDYYPDHDNIYILFSNYFKNPTMTKIKNINSDFSMYACKIYSLLSNQFKYIIAFVPFNNDPLSSTTTLSKLSWKNIQTRTLSENLKCNTHSYTPTYNTLLNKTIRRTSINDKSSVYTCPAYPFLQIDLLHNNKKDKNSYQSEGTLISGIETYETIVSLK